MAGKVVKLRRVGIKRRARVRNGYSCQVLTGGRSKTSIWRDSLRLCKDASLGSAGEWMVEAKAM